MLAKPISPEDYVAVKVNTFGKLLFYTRETLHRLNGYLEDIKPLTYDYLSTIMCEAKRHPVTVDLNDVFSELPEGRLSQEAQKRHLDSIRQVINHPTSTNALQYLYSVIAKINECVSRMYSAVRTVYVYHIGAFTSDDTELNKVKQSDDYIPTFLAIMNNIYNEFRPLDIIFGKIYWSFIFAHPSMKAYYRMVQDIYWRIFGMESHFKDEPETRSTEAADTGSTEDRLTKLFIKRNYYNADQTANWNVGRGFIKPNIILDSHQFYKLTTEPNPLDDSDSSQ